MVSATGDNLSYLWNNNASTSNISTSTVGTYLVTVSGTCGSVLAIPALLTANDCTPLVAVTSVTLTGFTATNDLSNTINAILVSLTGTGFVNGATVTIGGVVLGNVSVSGNVLTGTIPAGATIINPTNPSISIQNPNQAASVGVSITPTIITTTSINTSNRVNVESFSIYPNPTSGSFTIDAPNYTGAEIINLLGEVIQTVSLTDKTQVNIATKGLYLVRLYSNTNAKLVKINVE